MAPRLKVFSWSNGFHAFTVATPSRAKALAAWGIEQDIFKDGLARQIDHGPDHDAALASPGEVIQRGEAVDVGEVAKARAPSKPEKSPYRKRIEQLEADLEALDIRQAETLSDIDGRIAKLTAERDALADRQSADRAKIIKALKAARAAD